MRMMAVGLVLMGCVRHETDSATEKYWREIRTKGPRQTVNELNAQPVEWDAVMGNIRSGKVEWLKLAAGLRQGSDAGASFDLNHAMSSAIQNNAEGVLTILETGPFEVDSICVNPLIEPTPEDFEKFNQATISALQKVDGSRKPLADRCLSAFQRR